jgi:hypothetical protein
MLDADEEELPVPGLELPALPDDEGRAEIEGPALIPGPEGVCCPLHSTPAKRNPKIGAGRARLNRIRSPAGFEERSIFSLCRMVNNSPLMP